MKTIFDVTIKPYSGSYWWVCQTCIPCRGGDIKSRYEVKNPAKRSQWKMLQDENINDEYLK